MCIWKLLLCLLCSLCSESALSKNVPTQTSQPQTSVLNVRFFKSHDGIKRRTAFLVCVALKVPYLNLLRQWHLLCLFYVCAVSYRRNTRFGSYLFCFSPCLIIKLTLFPFDLLFWIRPAVTFNTECFSLKVSNTPTELFHLTSSSLHSWVMFLCCSSLSLWGPLWRWPTPRPR